MGLKRRSRHQSIDEVVLAALRHEYSASNPEATDAKIRRSLRYYGYDVEQGMRRVSTLRTFKNRLLRELGRPRESSYYVRAPGKQGFAALEDFDVKRLSDDCTEAFPSVQSWLVGAFVRQAIYLYYLR
jgi:hypothetical protein